METKSNKNIVNGFGSLSRNKASIVIKEQPKRSVIDVEQYEVPPGAEKQHLIKLEDLESYVRSMVESGGFKEQYRVLKNGPLKPWTHGEKAENKNKNRYNDILPYDDNRVVLQQLKNSPSSDYINASYMDSYCRKKSFIFTQGPLENTIGDFWRMIWQEEVNAIVMIANIFENGKKKCEKYWPDRTAKYADISVSLTKEEEFLEYTIRTMKIRKIGASKSRMVKQYQFTAWTDHEVPAYPLSIIYLMQDIAEFQKQIQKTSPVVLHCSAGVGRAGTVLAVVSALEMLEAEGKVDVLGILYKMRQQRINVIETEQYTFVYESLVEFHFGDITRRPSPELVLYFNKIRLTDPKTKKTGLQMQFEKLRELEPKYFNERCTVAKYEANKKKNRSMDVIPPDDGRPVLKTNPPTNYINAVYVHDYGKNNQFIVTQFPLPNTVSDFWQLLYDTKACTVVVLNEINRNDETSPPFWPTSGSMLYGNFKVENTASESEYINGVLARKLKIKNAKGSLKCHVIKMFELYGWRNKDHIPPQRDFILNLMNRVQQWRKKTGSHPVVVTCYDGYTASGFYCAASNIAGQVKNTQNVDVFHAVRTIRVNRPAFIPNTEQYRWLYEIACSMVTNKKFLK